MNCGVEMKTLYISLLSKEIAYIIIFFQKIKAVFGDTESGASEKFKEIQLVMVMKLFC